MIDTGQVLARFDASGAIIWQVHDLGTLVSITPMAQPATRYVPDRRDPAAPLPATGAWVVVTASRLAVVDPVAGKVRWSTPSTSPSVLIDGPQIVTTAIARDLIVDTATAVVVAKQGNLVEVTSELTVLD